MINPEIIKTYPGILYFREGCLSVDDVLCDTERYKEIKVRYTDETGRRVTQRFSGVDAVVAQHEIDHLNSIIMTDKAFNTVPIPKKETPKEETEAEPAETPEKTEE
jgi:peptide deformylase